MPSGIRITQDAFGWYLIQHKGRTLQAFKTEEACRAWLAATFVWRKLFGFM
jgi:hypothetical protein